MQLPPLQSLNFSDADLKYQEEQFKQDALVDPEHAAYYTTLIEIRERELAIRKEHPDATVAEMEKDDPILQQLNAQLSAMPAPDYLVNNGYQMDAP